MSTSVALQQQYNSLYLCSTTWTAVTSGIPHPFFKNPTGAFTAEGWDAIGSGMWCVVGWTNSKLAWLVSPLPHFLNTELLRWSSSGRLSAASTLRSQAPHSSPHIFTTERIIMWTRQSFLHPFLLLTPPLTPHLWQQMELMHFAFHKQHPEWPTFEIQRLASWCWLRVSTMTY